jgi:hypothetical protein
MPLAGVSGEEEIGPFRDSQTKQEGPCSRGLPSSWASAQKSSAQIHTGSPDLVMLQIRDSPRQSAVTRACNRLMP